MIYLDNAATTLEKPECVYDAVVNAMKTCGNAGRGGQEASMKASRNIFAARMLLTELFGGKDPSRLVFTANSTEALNIALHGLFEPGDHVITTEAEHNSVLRPLYEEEKRGILLTILPLGPRGEIDINAFSGAIRENTRAVVCTHGSNVLGNIYDIASIGELAHRKGLLFIVDASQTAGSVPIDVQQMHIDVLCFTGHKGLYGPQGVGGMYVREGLTIRPLLQGGSGVHSFRKEHPQDMPTALEAGTLNSHGIAGLAAAVSYIQEIGVEKIGQRERALAGLFRQELAGEERIRFYGNYSQDERGHGGIVSLNVGDIDSAEVSRILMEEYEIATRPGVHCAPLVHERMGTREQGMVRFSFSWFTREEEVKAAAKAVLAIAKELV